MRPAPLTPENLYTVCDPTSLPFDTTAELSPQEDGIGQERAVEAIAFAMAMPHRGFNLFALGAEGTGRRTLVLSLLRREAASRPVPDDWAYVHDFDDARRPRVLRLPAGRAERLRRDMDHLVDELGRALPAAFDTDDVRHRRAALEDEIKARRDKAFAALADEAAKAEIALIRSSAGLALAPMGAGEVLTPTAFATLPEERQTRFRQHLEALQEKLEATLALVPRWDAEGRERLRALEQDVAAFAISHLLHDLMENYQALPQVLTYLEAVRADLVANAGDFLAEEERQGMRRGTGGDPYWRYRVNVLVDHAESQGAPVLYEDNPTQPNLLGRSEHLAQMGALVTDFSLIRAGALHRANGGFLVLDAHKLLSAPFAWDDLKRALKAREIRIESPGQSSGLLPTTSLDPQPIPLDVKLVLIGDPELYYLLFHQDPEFAELFKVAADFDWRTDRTERSVLGLARFVADLTRQDGLRALDRGAVARLVEHSSRQVEDAAKLSTHRASLADLVREADHWAARQGQPVIGADHVQQAIDAGIRRHDRVREQVQDDMRRGIVHIATEGAEIGQINALAVLELGGFVFGHPARITARIHAGKGDVIDIEREVDLGGPLHGKGMLILTGFLAARFGAMEPLSLSASLVFEQSYGGIDGDSASSTELYVLLSALSGLAIRQDLAGTGSVDQFGRVQAIGNVNEKIEGFFDLCAARGLTGTQGVLIPASNVPHLMLRPDVVEACRQGRFAVYPVAHVDEGIALLTGVEAGECDGQGRYPAGSVNRKVQARLNSFAHRGLRAPDKDRKIEHE